VAQSHANIGGDITTIVEAKHPTTQKLLELTEVNLTQSGLLIMVTDADGNQAFIHRYAWNGIVKAVNELFEEERRSSLAWIATHPD